MFDLTGRVALVTGAGQSVGAGIAETLAECGAAVAVNDLYPDRAKLEATRLEKTGAISFMRHLALETAPFGVTANTLALGLMENAADRRTPGLRPAAPVGRAGTGRDVGAAVVWLAAEGSSVTGQTIGINGGSTTS